MVTLLQADHAGTFDHPVPAVILDEELLSDIETGSVVARAEELVEAVLRDLDEAVEGQRGVFVAGTFNGWNVAEKKLKEVLESVEATKGVEEKAGSDDLEPIKDEITIDDFSRVDLRVGIIREGHLVEGSKKLIRLMVDLGEEKPRQIFAGIKSHYAQPQDLVGTKVIVVANLKPRKMKFGISEGMVLAGGGGDDNRLCVAEFDGDLEPGDTVT